MIIKRILDIGCGTGFRTSRLAKRTNRIVTGIDISRANIKKAKELYPNAFFKKMSAEKILFPDNHFDEVYATDVLEHIDNLEPVILEIARVLKKQGILKIIVPSEKSENWLIQIRPSYRKEIHHVRVFKNNEIEKIFEDKGFVLKKMRRRDFLQHLELYYFFKTQKRSSTQLEIGSWRSNPISIFIHALVSMFNPFWVFNTPLIYFPLWIITLPIGYFSNFFGNKVMPKSIYWELVKTAI